jgi:hypothetical protein
MRAAWADKGVPLVEGIVADQLHAEHQVARHEPAGLLELGAGSVAIGAAEGREGLGRELRQSKIPDHEAGALDGGYDLSDVLVGIGLHHAESPLEI